MKGSEESGADEEDIPFSGGGEDSIPEALGGLGVMGDGGRGFRSTGARRPDCRRNALRFRVPWDPGVLIKDSPLSEDMAASVTCVISIGWGDSRLGPDCATFRGREVPGDV